MMTLENENPLGTDGFAFVEFVAQEISQMQSKFAGLGMALVGSGKQHAVSMFQQGEIRFFINACSDKHSQEFYTLHKEAPLSMGFYVAEPQAALVGAVRRGARAVIANQDSIWAGIPAIHGIGGSIIYLLSRDDEYLNRFNLTVVNTAGFGLTRIDHLTHNVFQGNMSYWVDFYQRIFGFREIRYFDIDGKITGLFSKAMTSPCGKIKIPLNESKDDKSQIHEFLAEFNGEGIQHIALATADIYSAVAAIEQTGLGFLNTPATYYEQIEQRLPQHGENTARMQKLGILIDGVTQPQRKLLLQIFTQNLLGPTFFEIIQRKGDEGFGEGNFKALFDSIELDQIRRGVLQG